MATPVLGIDVLGPTHPAKARAITPTGVKPVPLVDGIAGQSMIGKTVANYLVDRAIGNVYVASHRESKKQVFIRIVGEQTVQQGIEERIDRTAAIIAEIIPPVRITEIQRMDESRIAFIAESQKGVDEKVAVEALEQTTSILLDTERLVRTEISGFMVKELIGMGGMGYVFVGEHPITKQRVAIKVLNIMIMLQNAEFRARFEKEAKALAMLDHPNIVQLNNYHISPTGEAALVMNFVEGKNLGDIIREKKMRREGLSKKEVYEIFMQVFDALEYAHSKGVLHRDIKPSNIIVKQDGEKLRVKVADFGIAKIQGETDYKLTMTGATMGSPYYMPREAILGQPLTAAADVYSLAATIMEALTGKKLFEDDPRMGHLSKTPPTLTELGIRGSKFLNDVLQCALEKDPAKRFPNMRAFRDDFELAMRGELGEDRLERAKPERKRSFGKIARATIRIPIKVATTGALLVGATAVALNVGWIKREHIPSVSVPYVGDTRVLLSQLADIGIKDAKYYIERFDSLNLEIRATEGINAGFIAKKYEQAAVDFRKFLERKDIARKYGYVRINDAGLNIVAVPSLDNIADEEIRAALEKEGVVYRSPTMVFGYALYDGTIFISSDSLKKFYHAVALFLLEGNPSLGAEGAQDIAKRFASTSAR